MTDQLLKTGLEVFIQTNSNNKKYKMNVLDGTTLAHSNNLSPGIFKFEFINEGIIDIQEGDCIIAQDHGIPIFKGYVFAHEEDETGIIKVTAYDQKRYLQYLDTYLYKDKCAGDILKKWADYFGLKTGAVVTDSYRIPSRDEWSKSITDMLKYAIEITMIKSGRLLTLYDDAGEINLKYEDDTFIDDYYIDIFNTTGRKMTNSIDNETYNQVKLVYKNEKIGKIETFISKDTDNIKKWGLLQYYEEVNDQERIQQYADQMLLSSNVVRHTFSIKEVMEQSINHLRAGQVVMVRLSDGTFKLHRITSITHTWIKNNHLMDLNLYFRQ